MREGQKLGEARTVVALVVVAAALLASVIMAHSKSEWNAPADAKARRNPVPVNDSSIAAGKAIYGQKCDDCHGEKGDGDGAQAMMYKVKPANFTDTDMMYEMTDGELFWKITTGRQPMPSFKTKLTEDERWQVINFIRTFAKPQTATPAPALSDSKPNR